MLSVVAYLVLELVYGYGLWYFLNPFVSESLLLIVLFVYGLFVIAPILGKMMMLPHMNSDFTAWCVVNLLIVVFGVTVVALHSVSIFPPFLVLSLITYFLRILVLDKLIS